MTRYNKGYSLERHAVLTLQYMGYHVKRNPKSKGVEDIIALKPETILLVQVKNDNTKHNGMTKVEKEILKRHAMEIQAIPVFLYKEGRGKYVWLNLLNNMPETRMKNYTKEWYQKRQQVLKTLKGLKKSEKNKYVLENWEDVKNFVCD